ncbi:origin recognition complex2, putative [Acanthamoeba castellanii str. Neff]|uniref:Origin recognition complex subunit 2 n=1 Tax=Acanthamoeba castellanii (strain ATCC 30010 / Neff) TaxID=1257118 RepID=L8GLE1_ACACF|nr:origin recognition complex2, putative [Acanthamoeba castellanii str. Neff]ELR13629.1 origin recognition complex2, putative [Acanthamoeba castellanii str. Neff]
MDHDEERFQFCSLESEGVQAIQPSIEVVRQWHSEGNGKGRKRKKNTQPQLGVDDDEGEDYFAFQAKPSKTTKSSFKDLSDKVLIKAFIEGVPEQARNTEYAEHRALLHKELKKSFPKWMHQIQSGFNLLFYGFGSKLKLLDEFGKSMLSAYPLVTVEGYSPTTTVRNLLTMITQSVLGVVQPMPAEPMDHCRVLQTMFHSQAAARAARAAIPEDLFIIVHNIDGLALRSPAAQSVLARLASIPQIHMLASIDHAYAPLLWNHIMVGHFNFAWQDATTFEPYEHESEANLALYKSFGKNEVQSGHKSVRSVLNSVPANAKRIFKLLANTQLQKIKEMKELGGRGAARRKAIALAEFSTMCEQNLLAGGRDALNTHLREFFDHKIVKKVGQSGEEMLYVDMSEKELVSVLQEDLAKVD